MAGSAFINQVFEKAKAHSQRIVLPEGCDERVLEAANIITQKPIAKVTVLGDENKITSWFKEKKYDISSIDVINPETSSISDDYAKVLYEMRKHKGLSLEDAGKLVRQYNYFGTLMVKEGAADGLVSGAAQSTADTVRPALQIIKSANKGESVSSFFVMCVDDVPYIFSDCGLIQEPNAEELSSIAVQSALSAIKLGISPMVAMLSYSTHGSASSPSVDKVIKATELAKKKIAEEHSDKNIIIDGELQLDAAIVPKVAASKCSDSPLEGKARVLIFPDLGAGNIGYKLVQRMAGAEAYGPVLQGLNKPVNDLSRGCSVDDIVGTAAITVLQSLRN